MVPTIQTFNSEGSLQEMVHIHDYRENSHPVSPSPPKPLLPQTITESPFQFNSRLRT